MNISIVYIVVSYVMDSLLTLYYVWFIHFWVFETLIPMKDKNYECWFFLELEYER